MTEETTELGEKKAFEKQVLRLGQWKHAAAPNGILSITKEYIQKIADNFNKNPFVPVYRGHVGDDEAAKNPDLIITKNIQALTAKDDGLYAKFDLSADEIEKYNDVSLSIQDDYEDHETGEVIGPVARHVAMVPSPYIKGLQPFVALADKKNYSILLSEINMEDKKSEVVEEKVEEVTPVADPTKETSTEEKAPVEEVKEETKSEEKTEDKEEPKTETIDNSESSEDIRVQLEEMKKANTELREKLTKQEALSLYNKFAAEGKVLPVFKDQFMLLASLESSTINLADGKTKAAKDVLKEMFENMPALISLSEKGINSDTKNAVEIPLDLAEDHRKSYFLRNPDATEEDYGEYVKENRKVFEKFAPKK